MVDDEFVANLPAAPLLALNCIVAESSKFQTLSPDNAERGLIPLLALAITLLKKSSITFLVPPEMTGDAQTNCAHIVEYFQTLGAAINTLTAQNLLQTSLSSYERKLNVGFHYEFSEGEIERLQALINELREAIGGAGYLDEDHRRRLLGRLEKLQAELHKRISDLDLLLGVIFQIGAAAGRFGEDAKPLVDRVREIAEIVAGVFRRAEKLPPGHEFPLLPKPDNPDL